MLFAPLWGGIVDSPVKDSIALIDANALSPPDLTTVTDYLCGDDAVVLVGASLQFVKAECTTLPELALEAVAVTLEYQPLQALG